MKHDHTSETPSYEASTLPYVCWYQNDFLGGVRGMRAHEIGIYTILLNEIYARGRPLDLSEERLARLCGCDKRTFVTVLEMLISEGKILNLANGLWNERCGHVFEERAQLLKKKSYAGHASAKKRKKINTTFEQLSNNYPRDETHNSEAQKGGEKETPYGVSKKRSFFSLSQERSELLSSPLTPTNDTSQGSSLGSSQDPSQGLSQDSSQNSSQALSQGSSLGSSLGSSQALSQGSPQDSSQNSSQAPSQALSQGLSQGSSLGSSQGLSQGSSQNPSQGLSQGISQGPDLCSASLLAPSRDCNSEPISSCATLSSSAQATPQALVVQDHTGVSAEFSSISSSSTVDLSSPTAMGSPKRPRSEKSPKGQRLPLDWRADIGAAISEGLSEEQARWQEKKFRDYWHAKSGKDALKVDWQATWRNWFRREIERLQDNREKLSVLSSSAQNRSRNTNEDMLYQSLINY
ncbi:YdaU family protein [Bartonella sp. F02]|uniref:YdaU family protein n=1 Tax=Bartonella sp. F02 TaxID=2967262 RepID=UPI0022A91AD3|nr:DUF1376 domain-containing protein [Bartonella sp. F02]MCZ2328855.1 YdaU family protein [Bartonella sp. F02]